MQRSVKSGQVRIEKPIIILGAPRSGTTLLFSIFSSHPDLWSLYGETEPLIQRYFHPEKFNWKRGEELVAGDAAGRLAETLKADLYKKVLNRQLFARNTYTKVYSGYHLEKLFRKVNQVFISPAFKPGTVRVVEKTPKNCLRVPFLEALFPDAFYVFLSRDPRTNISSLIEGWKTAGRYETHRVPGGIDIEGYNGDYWNFNLSSGWQDYSRGRRLEEVCAWQYRVANRMALDALDNIPESRRVSLKYEDLISRPEEIIGHLCARVGVSYAGGLKSMAETMPPVNSSGRPDKEKWRNHEAAVESVLDSVKSISERLRYSVSGSEGGVYEVSRG